MRYQVSIEGRRYDVRVTPDGVTVDDDPVDAQLLGAGGSPVRGLLLGSASYRLVAREGGAGVWRITVAGRTLEVEVADPRARTAGKAARSHAQGGAPRALRAPMPGLVVKVEVESGDDVETGQGLMVVEAMKMENELKAVAPGRVRTVHVRAGQAVERDDLLVDFDPPAGSEDT